MKQRAILLSILCISSLLISATSSPNWMRYCSISPDGTQIAFTYKGNIYTVPSKGGRASILTTHPAHDTHPIWSPNSKQIAFASEREGSFDIFIINASGGTPQRLTTHSAHEYPIAFLDDEHILFSAPIYSYDTASGIFPGNVFPRTFKISNTGGRPQLFSANTMENISISPNGKQILYHNKKGYEDNWRKHQQSSIARDIWLYDTQTNQYRQQTTFRGENRNPVWHPQGQSFYYLSEESGCFNIHKRTINNTQTQQITHFKQGPVRFLSIAQNGTLCFGANGQIYTKEEGKEPQKISIEILTDQQENQSQHINFTQGASEMTISPNGKEIAFIIRGDIFVASIEYGTTRRITNTPEQERNVSYSPDGTALLYASERDGVWGIYQSKLTNKNDKQFLYAQEWKEEPIVKSNSTSFQPQYSPDGKKVAFLENRTTIKSIDLSDKKVQTILDGKHNYSYSDGDQWFRWSPNGEWILSQYLEYGCWPNTDIALVKSDGSGTIMNLTQSGYKETMPRFSHHGKSMVWLSDRAGYRSHGSWGAHRDAYIMFFEQDSYEKFLMNKEELEHYKEVNKTDSASIVSDIVLSELKNSAHRIVRLTPSSSALSDALLNKKGDKLYYLTHFQNNYDLWEADLKKHSVKILSPKVGSGVLQTDKDEKHIIFISQGTIKKIELATGKVIPIPIQAQFNYQPPQERNYIFDHVWRQIQDKFYETSLHNVDWGKIYEEYQQFLPHINNNHDFAEMLSEMLGELNVSHTGARYRPRQVAPATASLGALFSSSYNDKGVQISEIISQGPLDKANTRLRAGSIILKIDNTPIPQGQDFHSLLTGKAGKRTLITFINHPDEVNPIEEWIKPISLEQEAELLYKRWVEKRRATTEKLSNGRIGYVHVRGMNSDSFREVYSQLLGKYRNCEAVVIDTRHNGGGWLHDDLVTLLSGKEYQKFIPRGQYLASDPHNKWIKPSIVLMCENNYSNAHGFPWLYKELGVGQLVGAPVPGTMTAVWWEIQIDPTLVFGIPQVAIKDMQGDYLENKELFPDIEVYNSPSDMETDNDIQLQRAIEELLQRK